ncbi:MAG: hypothetical protein JO032_18405 [Alphaproteobacteria bacterium]|nr:hypothetical protein [Alphaproteobacteria bacterium]MBV9554760.1 hypothetical protein [Alphaproteobacteria bacterium]
MARANINDRISLEAAYPAERFARDAAQNDVAPNQLVRGVRIGSAPDEAGWFDLEPAARHVGEPETPHFVAPARRVEPLVERGRYSAPRETAAPDPDDGYRRFLDDIVDAARRFGYRAEASPGIADPRLKGLRQ